MSDEEIMKALECCASTSNVCDECPIAEELKEACKCGEYLFGEILDLIYRQRAEIERLKDLVRVKKEDLSKYENLIKSETVREFAERLKEIVKFTDDTYECWEIEGYIDDLVKEMVGDEK